MRVRGALGEEEVTGGRVRCRRNGEQKINTKLALHAAKQLFTALVNTICITFIQRRGERARSCTLVIEIRLDLNLKHL